MIPFQKIFTLVIRTFSKPMLSYMKRKQQEKKMQYFSTLFILIGRRYHAMESWLNYRILKSTNKKTIVELKEDMLLEKGIEGFYELLFYCIVLGLPFYELYKGSVSAQKKEENLQKRIAKLQKKMGDISQKIDLLSDVCQEKIKRSQQGIALNQQKRKLLKQQAQKEQMLKAMSKDSAENSNGDAVNKVAGEGKKSEETHQAEEEKEESSLLESALQVISDQFEDVLDDLQFATSNSDDSIDVGDSTEDSDLTQVTDDTDVSDSNAEADVNVQISTEPDSATQ